MQGTSQTPRVTIGIPVLNGANYLEETIQSIRAQTFADFELIVADNASSDATSDIVHRHAIEDQRIRVITHEQTIGAHHNYDSLVPLARGEFFKWAAHDDLLEPGFLEACVNALDSHPEAVLAFTKIKIIDDAGEVVGRRSSSMSYFDANPSERFRRYIGDRNRSEPTFGVYRLDVLRKTPLLQHFPGSDWVLLSELALRGPFVEVDDELFSNRNHSGRSTKATVDSRLRGHWFEPGRTRPIAHHWSQLRGQTSGIMRAPLSGRERAICLAFMVKWAVVHAGDLLGDIWVRLTVH